MNCQQVFDRLSAYLDGELTDEDRRAFEAHVDGCTQCSQFGAEFGAVVTALRRASKPETPPGLLDQLRLGDSE